MTVNLALIFLQSLRHIVFYLIDNLDLLLEQLLILRGQTILEVQILLILLTFGVVEVLIKILLELFESVLNICTKPFRNVAEVFSMEIHRRVY